MMSWTRLYVEPIEALMSQAGKKSILILIKTLMKILVGRSGQAGETNYILMD